MSDDIDHVDDVAEAVDDDTTEHRNVPVFVIAIVVVVVVGLLVVVLATREPATDRQVSSPLIGRAAPEVVGTTLAGSQLDLADLQGQWTLVNFFATWCAPCRQEHDDLARFHDRHQTLGDAGVVSVVFDDTTDNARSFFDENGGGFPVVIGDEGDIALDYGVVKVPESYLVSPDGVVVAKIIGGVTFDGLEAILDRAQGSS